LHRHQVMVKFLLAREESLILTLLLGVIPCQYRRKWYIAKTRFSGLYFCLREYRCIKHFYVIRPESYRVLLVHFPSLTGLVVFLAIASCHTIDLQDKKHECKILYRYRIIRNRQCDTDYRSITNE